MEFPLKSNGGYLKTCIKCAQAVANRVYAKNHTTGANQPIKTRRRRIQDRTAGDTLVLKWDEFLTLLHDNKECAFELHAIVSLDFDGSSKENGEANVLETAWAVARAVREQTGYRFK